MGRKTVGTVRELLLGLMRTKGFMVIWILAFVFTCYSHSYYSFREGLYSYAQLNAAKGLEVMMLVMLMTGHRLVRWMQEDGVLEVYSSLYQGRTLLARGQMATVLIIAALTSGLMMIFDILTSLFAGAPWEWIAMSSGAMVLQFFLPLVICALAGMCAAYWIKNRAAYGVILLFWCLTGSLSDKIFAYLTLSGIMPSHFWGQILNLGIQDAGTQMMDFVGGPLREFPRWIVKIGYMLWLIVLFWVSSVHSMKSSRDGRYRFAWKPLAAALMIIPMMGGFHFVFGDFFTHYSSTMRGQIYMGDLYSAAQESLTSEVSRSREDHVTVLENELTVASDIRGLHVTSVQTIRADQDIWEQCFTLYRDLKIKEVLLDGKPTEYIQSGDAVYICFHEVIKAAEQFELSFTYSGKTMPQVKANEYTVQLRSEFPWFPWPGLREDSEYLTALMDEAQIGQDDVAYKLHYSGPGDLFVNLQDMGGGEYSGNSDYGINLFSGMMIKEYDDLKLYLPAALYSQADGYYHFVRDELDLYGSLEQSVGWLLEEGVLESAWEKYRQVSTAYIIQDLVNQESGTLVAKGKCIEVRFVGAGPASTAASMAAKNYIRNEKDLYRRMVQKICEIAGLTKAEMSDGRYAFFGDYLSAYCRYRDGLVEDDGLKAFLREENDYILKLMPKQAEVVAEIWKTTPADKMNEFFVDWFEKLLNRDPPYDCLVGDEVFSAMVEWTGK